MNKPIYCQKTLEYDFDPDYADFEFEVDVTLEDFYAYAMTVLDDTDGVPYQKKRAIVSAIIDEFDLYDALDTDDFTDWLMELHREEAEEAYAQAEEDARWADRV